MYVVFVFSKQKIIKSIINHFNFDVKKGFYNYGLSNDKFYIPSCITFVITPLSLRTTSIINRCYKFCVKNQTEIISQMDTYINRNKHVIISKVTNRHYIRILCYNTLLLKI